MLEFFGVILAVILISCSAGSEKSTQNKARTLEEAEAFIEANEQKSIKRTFDTLGILVKSIEFNVKTDSLNDFPSGFVPWASLEQPVRDLPGLDKKDEVVLPDSIIEIIIDYPVKNQFRYQLNSDKGFTREQLLLEISKRYFKMYEEEEKTATVKTIPPKERTGIYNRNQTNGIYGIWGHDIADLVLSEVKVYKTQTGKTILTLDIQS